MLILLNPLVLAQREKLEETRDLAASELAGFLDQGRMVERNWALLTNELGR